LIGRPELLCNARKTPKGFLEDYYCRVTAADFDFELETAVFLKQIA
jgi:hypothetical protein